VGGGSEEEARLSDISLDWMLHTAERVGLKYDPAVLRLHPDPGGMQHEECKSSVFRLAGKAPRKIPHDPPLHASVLERFKAGKVLNYDLLEEYRPESLRTHDLGQQYYD
jgi:hypothetical protein